MFYLVMIDNLSTTCWRAAGLLLAICFTASMFMCGDADCLNGNSNEDCASLLCSLLNKHATASPDTFDGNVKDCSCVCHMPTVIPSALNFGYHPILFDNRLAAIAPIISAPNRLVYHPPATV